MLAFITLLCGTQTTFAQYPNLILNGNFDQIAYCGTCAVPSFAYPTQLSTVADPELEKAAHWKFGDALVLNTSQGTADYYHSSGVGAAEVPDCGGTCGKPRACTTYSNHYVGMGIDRLSPGETAGTPQGESIKGKLQSLSGAPITPGTTYVFKAWVHNKSTLDIDLTVQLKSSTNPYLIQNVLVITTVPVLSAGSCGWSLVQGTFTIPSSTSTVITNQLDRIDIGGYYNGVYSGQHNIYMDRVSLEKNIVPLADFAKFICVGECVTINSGMPAAEAPYASYSWLPAGTPNVSSPSVCPTTTTTYTCTVTYGTQTFTTTTTVNVSAGPPLHLINYSLCTSDPMPILDGGPTPVSYSWSYIATGTTTSVSAGFSRFVSTGSFGYGEYIVTVTGANGCTTTGSFYVLLDNSAAANLDASFTFSTTNTSTTTTISTSPTTTTGDHMWEIAISDEDCNDVSAPLQTIYTTNATFAPLPLNTYYRITHYIKRSPCNEWAEASRCVYQTTKMIIHADPNPTTGVIRISIEGFIDGQVYQAQIHNRYGILMEEFEMKTAEMTIDISRYANDLYILSITAGTDRESVTISKE